MAPDREDRHARLEAYLLGTLDDESRQAVREAAIRHDEVAAELREIELDLLDDVARGALSGERLRAATALARAPHNRSAWIVAQALAARPRPQADTQSAWRSGWHHRGFLSMAAGLILAVGLASYFVAQPTPEGSRWVAIPPPRTVTPAAAPAADQRAFQEHATAPDTEPPPVVPAPRKTADTAGVLALYLPATTVRGGRPIARISSAIRTIRLELELDPPFASDTVTVTLRPAPGAGVWTSPQVPVTIAGDGTQVVVTMVPASLLPTGPVEAVISSTAGPDGPERIVSFIVRRD